MISFVIPVYNGTEFLNECVSSCLDAGELCSEVILVNDGSAAAACQEIQRVSQLDPKIKIVNHRENLGTFEARRSGTLQSRSHFIVFIDADDYVKVECWETLSTLLSYNDCNIIIYNVVNVKDDFDNRQNTAFKLKSNMTIKKLMSKRKFHYGTPGKMYRRSFLLKCYEEISVQHNLIYGEDAVLFAIATKKLSDVALASKGMKYMYRKNNISITNDNTLEKIKLKLTNLQRCLTILNSIDTPIKSDVRKTLLMEQVFLENLKLKKIGQYSFFNHVKQYWKVDTSIVGFVKLFFYCVGMKIGKI